MDFSLTMAKVLAVYMVVSGLFLLLRAKTLPMLLKDFFGHPAVVYLAGAILVFLGSTLVFRSQYWAAEWQTWTMLFGALVLLKGIVYILIPQALARIHLERSRVGVAITGLISIALGVLLFFITIN